MSSIIEGYNYDIFISYRQKDNKHDGWVTEFADNLKGELESTFKEEVSVYFDINPHDGLLETHDVDASLKEKLKCLIFIPIISRTYCDPKSFAWENEFKAFVEQASQDKFGLKIKLPGGNVASRVLPVQIHDLDSADIMLCEYILDGVLRGIEFIYKEPGVNRPLTPYDDENKNFNKTRYRNQINKVALAINELIKGLETEPEWQKFEKRIGHESFRQPEEIRENEKIEVKEKPAESAKWKLLSAVAVAAILIIASIITYPKIFKRDSLEKLRSSGERISIAVMPFRNMTNDTTWNVWQDGIQDILIASFSDSPDELVVRQSESINSLLQSKGLTNYASIRPSVARKISLTLDANIFIYGKIIQAGRTIRVSAQLINSRTKEVLKSFQREGIAENILRITDSLSVMVRNFLLISKLEKEEIQIFKKYISTNSPDAYRYCINGQNAFYNRDYTIARDWLLQAIKIDSNLNYAIYRLSWAYTNQKLYEEAKKWCLKIYNRREQMPHYLKLSTNRLYSVLFETPQEEIMYLKELAQIDDQSPTIHYTFGAFYNNLYQYDNAIPEFEKSLELYKKWDLKPEWVPNYSALGYAYHKTHQYKKEKKLYKTAERHFPDNPGIIDQQAYLSLTEGDTIAAKRFIEKWISIRRKQSWSEARIANSLAQIYSLGGDPEKEGEYYRHAFSLEPDNPNWLNNLAYFLIDNNRNINEGLELIDKALNLSPDNYDYLDTKGWGLYKQGKYKEALDVLQKADSLKPIYVHKLYLHLEAAKKAVASQKNN